MREEGLCTESKLLKVRGLHAVFPQHTPPGAAAEAWLSWAMTTAKARSFLCQVGNSERARVTEKWFPGQPGLRYHLTLRMAFLAHGLLWFEMGAHQICLLLAGRQQTVTEDQNRLLRNSLPCATRMDRVEWYWEGRGRAGRVVFVSVLIHKLSVLYEGWGGGVLDEEV